jgi:flagellar hook-length control protein FliK
MSAPFSTSSLANSLNLRVSTPSARNAVLGIDGIGASSDSFSRTLQNQMNAGGNASARSESTPSRAPESPREPERSPERSAADEGAKATHTDRADQNANAPTRSGEPAAGGEKDSSATGKDARATSETTTVTDESAGAQATAAAHASAQAEAEVGGDALASAAAAASATPPTDPAALAGLPAALAALLSGHQAPPSGEADAELATDAPLLATDGKGRSLQNSGLLPKTDVSAEAGGRGVATPAFLLQGRELAAAVISARGAASGQALQSLQGEPGSAGSAQGVQGLHTHGAMHLLRHAPATQAATPQLPVHTPAGQQAWAEDVGNQVRWMLGRAESKAELVLTPPNLGKLEVSINLNGDQTTAQFIASSQAARDALERAMPQLREVLQQAGIMLADANVSTSQHGAGSEGQEGRGRDGGRGEAASAGEAGGTVSGTGVWLRQQQGMVDTFA